MLEIEDVRKHYVAPGEVVKAVDGASLAVDEGELVAVFGPSGSGKSTLLALIGALRRPDSGVIRFRGRDINRMTQRELYAYRRNDVGFVFQDFLLLNTLTARSNVAIRFLLNGDNRPAADEKAHALLDLVGLGRRSRQYAYKLSGGEKQRVAIARALAGTPSLILADEPTGNLDLKRGEQVLALLGELARERGVAVVLATHDLRAIPYADRVLEIRDGRLHDFDLAAVEADVPAPS